MKLLLVGAICIVSTYALPVHAQNTAQPRAASQPVPPSKPQTLDVFLRSDPSGPEATFTAKPEHAANARPITLCSAPCQTTLAPGSYKLELNHLPVERPLRLERTSTLYGRIDSHAQSRAVGLVALYLGGVLGGSLIGVAILGAPTWTYAAGGGVVGASAAIWLITNRSDRAVVKLTLGLPPDNSLLPANPTTDAQRSAIGQRLSAGFGLRGEF
jgi:hypothetical protein